MYFKSSFSESGATCEQDSSKRMAEASIHKQRQINKLVEAGIPNEEALPSTRKKKISFKRDIPSRYCLKGNVLHKFRDLYSRKHSGLFEGGKK